MATVKQLANAAGISYGTVYSRLRRGWPSESVWTPPRKHTRLDLTWNGRTQSANAWAKELGVTRGRLLSEMARGVPLDQIRPAAAARMITHDGRTQSVLAWSKELGIAESTIHNRILKGTDPLAPPVPRAKVWYDGKTAAELAAEAGIPLGTMYARLRRQPAAQARKPREPSIAERARAVGLIPDTVRSRIRRGISLQDALAPRELLPTRRHVNVYYANHWNRLEEECLPDEPLLLYEFPPLSGGHQYEGSSPALRGVIARRWRKPMVWEAARC